MDSKAFLLPPNLSSSLFLSWSFSHQFRQVQQTSRCSSRIIGTESNGSRNQREYAIFIKVIENRVKSFTWLNDLVFAVSGPDLSYKFWSKRARYKSYLGVVYLEVPTYVRDLPSQWRHSQCPGNPQANLNLVLALFSVTCQDLQPSAPQLRRSTSKNFSRCFFRTWPPFRNHSKSLARSSP